MKTQKKIIACMVIMAMLLHGAAVFAQKDSGGTEVSGWNFFENNCDATVSLVNDEANSGKNSLHIVNKTSASGESNYFRVHTEVNFPEKGQYKFGCYIKTKNAGNTKMFIQSNMPSIVPFSKTRDWQRFEFTYDRAEAGGDWLGIITYDKCDDIWIDDVFLYLIDENGEQIGENLVQNPSFEANVASGSSGTAVEDGSGYYYHNDNLKTVGGYLARSKNIPVSYVKNMQIDGSTEDWNEIMPIHMSGLQNYSNEKIENDAQIRYAYNDEKFYFLIEVTDPVHYDGASAYWQNDSIQVMLSTKPESFGTEVGVQHKGDGTTYKTHQDIEAVTSRIGNKTIYEVGVQWGNYIPGSPERFSFNAIVNNNDSGDREYCLEIAQGISQSKSGTYAPVLDFLPDGQKYYSTLNGSAEAQLGRIQEYELSILNWGDAKSFDIKIPDAKIVQKPNVANNAVETVSFSKHLNEVGNLTIGAEVDGESIECQTIVYPDRPSFDSIVDGYNADLSKINDLMEKCTQKGITTEYERADAALMKRAIEVMTDKMNEGDMSIIPYNLTAVRKVLDETIDSLNGYLSGEKREKPVTNYITSPIRMQGESFYAQSETKGKVEETPVFLIGYNTGWEGRDERSNWDDFGVNLYSEGYMFDEIVGYPNKPCQWEENPVGNGFADADYNVMPGVGANDSGALHIVNRSSETTDGKGSYLWQFINIKPNTTYKYGYKVKGEVKNKMSLAIDTMHWITGNYENWTSFDYSFTSDEAPNYPIIMLHVPDEVDNVYVDDIYLYEGDSDVNLISNGGFESYYEPLEGTPYGINRYYLRKFKEALQREEYNNVAVMLDLTFHAVPKVVKENINAVIGGGFLPYSVENDAIIEAMRVYLEEALAINKEYGCTFCIELHNEPTIDAASYDLYVPSWQTYLVEKYETIDKLNEVYESSYENFADVIMPKQISESSKDVLQYDYRVFNEGLADTYFQKLYDIVKEIDPNILVTNKFMIDLCSSENNTIGARGTRRGINFDHLYRSSDIARNDAWAYLGNSSATLQAKLEWYDYQADISGTPVYNMEDHIMFDTYDMDFNENMPAWYYANVWQGALHGLGADMIWLWGRSDDTENGLFSNTTIQYRADCMHLTNKIGKDLNRLGREVAAVKDRKADVALLYSHPSRSYETFYMNSLYNAYLATQYNGVKPFFLSEDQTERLKEFDTLIVPEAIHVKRQVLDAVLDFVRNGGKLVMIGENCLSYDENNQPMPQELLNEIKTKATILKSDSKAGEYYSAAKDSTADFLAGIFRDSGKIKVELKDSVTGAKVKDTEVLWAEYNDSYILNICSYDWDSAKNIVIEIDGKKVGAMTDLLELEDWGDTVTLEPYMPVMVQIKK